MSHNSFAATKQTSTSNSAQTQSETTTASSTNTPATGQVSPEDVLELALANFQDNNATTVTSSQPTSGATHVEASHTTNNISGTPQYHGSASGNNNTTTQQQDDPSLADNANSEFSLNLFLQSQLDYKPQHKLPVYALVRFYNEVITLRQSLNSLLPTITKGILITHKCPYGLEDDGSLALALDFCNKNPGFKLVVYPFPVYNANHEKYTNVQSIPRESFLDAYTTYGVQCVKELAKENGDLDPWVFKADADNLYDAVCLDKQLVAISQEEDFENQAYYFVKLNVHYDPCHQELQYLGTQVKQSSFLVKAKYLQVGMKITPAEVQQPPTGHAITAQEVYFHQDPEIKKLTFNQTCSAIKKYLDFKFFAKGIAQKYNNISTYSDNFTHSHHASQTLAQLHEQDNAQKYALQEVRSIKVVNTNYINALHFKYVKFVAERNCRMIPQGSNYQQFLSSPEFVALSQRYPCLTISEFFTNVDAIMRHCQNFNFCCATEHVRAVENYQELQGYRDQVTKLEAQLQQLQQALAQATAIPNANNKAE